MPSIDSLPTKAFFRVLAHLNMNDIIYLALSNKDVHALCSDYRSEAFDITSKLLLFFPSQDVVQAFRQQLIEHNAVISGSFALQFFSRTCFPSSDMDVYVSVEHAQGLIESWLPRGLINLFNEDGKNIQVVIVQHSPVKAILGFHSTAVMNFITGSRAFSLYPYASFVEQMNLMTGTLTDKFVALMAIAKYEQRGYATVNQLEDREFVHIDANDPVSIPEFGSFCERVRIIGDAETWTIPFGDFAKPLDGPIYEGNVWHLESPRIYQHRSFVQVCANYFKHRSLRHGYTTVGNMHPRRFLRRVMEARLDREDHFMFDKEYVQEVKDWKDLKGHPDAGLFDDSDTDSDDN
ncbi:hypothetical protein C8J56DRAFT_883158 [Mycena floridula]|nr:hypothetical protein C8J56DRAFT_883158 [Mycena floridula]